MALSYTKVDIRGVAAEPILEEILFENKTIADSLVTFETDVKSETIFTEGAATTTMQAFSSGAPSSSGSLDLFDVAITPYKYMYYQEFDPNTLRSSRFKRDMKAGAYNMFSNEFERIVIGGLVAKNMSYDVEYKFWNDITSTQQTAIAALTPGTGQTSIGAAEQTWAAARTAGLFNGVVSSMLYNTWSAAGTAAVGGRIKVAGTTVTSSNIYTEVNKVYAAFLPQVLAAQGKTPYIYVPHAYKQLINIYNSTPTNYLQPFSIRDGKYFIHDIEIVFVPLVGDVMIGSAKEHIFWCTDLTSDVNLMKVDKIAENREDMFIKSIGTVTPYIGQQATNVLYIG
jgi:hypothetical protein